MSSFDLKEFQDAVCMRREPLTRKRIAAQIYAATFVFAHCRHTVLGNVDGGSELNHPLQLNILLIPISHKEDCQPTSQASLISSIINRMKSSLSFLKDGPSLLPRSKDVTTNRIRPTSSPRGFSPASPPPLVWHVSEGGGFGGDTS